MAGYGEFRAPSTRRAAYLKFLSQLSRLVELRRSVPLRPMRRPRRRRLSDILSGITTLFNAASPTPINFHQRLQLWRLYGRLDDRFTRRASSGGLRARDYRMHLVLQHRDIQFSRETLHQGTPWRNNQNMIERLAGLLSAKMPGRRRSSITARKTSACPWARAWKTYHGTPAGGALPRR